LLRLPPYVGFLNPFAVDPHSQRANHVARRQHSVAVLPAARPEHRVEPILNEPGVQVRDRQGAAPLHALRLPADFIGSERRGKLIG
jgi:hypothetical protein